MRVRYNNEFGGWLKKLMDDREITSSRQIKYKTGVSHTTIESILAGSQPSVETVIRIAGAYGERVPVLLRLAGHEEIAEVWDSPETHEAVVSHQDVQPVKELSYEPAEDEDEAMSYYRGIPPELQPTAKRLLKAMMEEDQKRSDREEGHVFGGKNNTGE